MGSVNSSNNSGGMNWKHTLDSFAWVQQDTRYTQSRGSSMRLLLYHQSYWSCWLTLLMKQRKRAIVGFAVLVLWEGNPPVTDGFSSQSAIPRIMHMVRAQSISPITFKVTSLAQRLWSYNFRDHFGHVPSQWETSSLIGWALSQNDLCNCPRANKATLKQMSKCMIWIHLTC